MHCIQIGMLRRFVFKILFLLILLLLKSYAQNVPAFEYKYSFDRPLLILNKQLFLWHASESVLIESGFIRLTPSVGSIKGRLWSKIPWSQPNFEVHVSLSIGNKGKLGADGMAIWFTAQRGEEGNTFGCSDHFNGMGIFLDSYDNDQQHNNPHIGVMINDGTRVFNQDQDGSNELNGGCVFNYRNQPVPTHLNISYVDKTLTVSYAFASLQSAALDNQVVYKECVKLENVNLPPVGYFGLSAATGGMADDHDVYRFRTYSIKKQAEPKEEHHVEDDEYREFYKKLHEQKEQYAKEHPDAIEKHSWENEEDWVDTIEGKEFKLLLESQSRMEHHLMELSATINNVMVNAVGGTNQPNNQINQQYSQQLQSLKQSFDALSQQIHNFKNSPQGIPPSPFADKEIKEQLNHMNELLQHISRKPTKECPKLHLPSCISPMHFIIFLALQISIVAGILMYNHSQNNRAKKFF